MGNSNFHMELKQDGTTGASSWSFSTKKAGGVPSYVIGSEFKLATRILDLICGWPGTSCHFTWLVHRIFPFVPNAIADFSIFHPILLAAGLPTLHHD